jgi:hypothetical protein
LCHKALKLTDTPVTDDMGLWIGVSWYDLAANFKARCSNHSINKGFWQQKKETVKTKSGNPPDCHSLLEKERSN